MYKATFRFLCAALLTTGLVMMNAPGHAADSTMLELLKILRDKGSISGQEYELLRQTALAEGEKKTAQTAVKPGPEVVAVAKPSPEITMTGKLEFMTDEHKFRIGGRAQHDVTLVGNDNGGNAGSSEQQFRRARIYLSGTAWEHWDWKFQFDLEDADDNSMSIEDAFIKYKAWDPADIIVGQRKAPFSLSALTSSKYITFIERATPTDLFTAEAIGIGGRSPGISLENAGDKHTLAGGLYLMRQRADDTDSTSERKIDDGWGFTGE